MTRKLSVQCIMKIGPATMTYQLSTRGNREQFRDDIPERNASPPPLRCKRRGKAKIKLQQTSATIGVSG